MTNEIRVSDPDIVENAENRPYVPYHRTSADAVTMGQTLYFVVAAASLLSITPQMRALHVYTQATTMTSAAHWARVAFAGWVLALTGDWLSPSAESRWSDQMWYLACVLSLTPFAAALGAKRPGTRIWSVFVILPSSSS